MADEPFKRFQSGLGKLGWRPAPFNNPSLIAVLMATLPGRHLCWPATREERHVVSVGAGTVRAKLPQKIAAKINVLDQIEYLASAMLMSVDVEQDALCRILGRCVHGASTDAEIGCLDAPSLFNRSEQKLTYTISQNYSDCRAERQMKKSLNQESRKAGKKREAGGGGSQAVPN